MRSYEREDRLILASARYPLGLDDPRAINDLSLDSLDWKYVMANCGRHGLMPMLFKMINDFDVKESVPDSAFNQLRSVYLASLFNNVSLFKTVRPVLEAFNAESIPAILLKGAALCLTTYDDMALRQCGDIDILVPRKNVDRCRQIMEEMGFLLIRNNYFPIPDDRNEELGCEWSYHKDGTVIELHWDLINKKAPFDIDIASFWHNARKIDFEGRPALVMNPNNQLLHLCLHQFKHLWEHLRDLTDIALILELHKEELDWQYIATTAQAQGLERCVYFCLDLTKQILGTSEPRASAIYKLGYHPGKIAHGMENLIADHVLEKHLPRRLWELMLVGGNRKRFLLLGHTLAHPFPRPEEKQAHDYEPGETRTFFNKLVSAVKTAFYYRKLIVRFPRHLLGRGKNTR